MESDSESEYESEGGSSKRNSTWSTWPGTEGSTLDEQLELPKGNSEYVINQQPIKRAHTSSASLPLIRTSVHHGYGSMVHFAPEQANSPWKLYQEDWRLGRHNAVTVAYKKSKPDQMYTIRAFTKSQARGNLEMIRQLHHKNLIPIHEVFAFQQRFFIICPYMDISLERINGSPRYLCDPQLAELTREVLSGIAYLASEGWIHSNINCSNILLSLKDAGGARTSEVKITNIESCSKISGTAAGRIDSKALGIVMMKVMEKDSQPKGSFGLRHPERWSGDAVDFLSMTQVSTPEKLTQHQFVANYKQHGSLVRLIAFANVAAFGGFYNYDKSAELF